MVSFVRARSRASRCPGCGEPLPEHAPPHCPLCAYEFEDHRATSEDRTPYALAYAAEERGWLAMVVWVWGAGTARLKHLALMRASAASRLFARTNLLILAFALSGLVWTRFGWTTTGNRVAREGGHLIRPEGSGWIRVGGAPDPLPAEWTLEATTDLWWNPPQAIVAVVTGLLLALLVQWIWAMLMQVGIRQAHRAAFRSEQRMSAAFHYGTAWAIPLLLPCLVFWTAPVSFLGAMWRSRMIPSRESFAVIGGAIGGVVLALWWFWLVRIAFSSPAPTRGRVVAFLIVGAPLITTLLWGGWWRALPELLGPVFRMVGWAG